jgi:uncharacterized protein (DUF2164 family)
MNFKKEETAKLLEKLNVKLTGTDKVNLENFSIEIFMCRLYLWTIFL